MKVNNCAAVYCRLSKDDEQCGDSVSIETQKMMLTKYCLDNHLDIYDIYVDDGYSGLNFERPSFKRLINDLEQGRFSVVVTKDLSRLGRDYIQTGYYIDIYFVSKRIRYIAVNDGIDTKLDNNDIAPFRNILNDMYAKDLSRKVKSAKRQRAENGLYISSQPPYGYMVNPHNRGQLIIDPEAARTVAMIFDLVEVGNSYSEIGRILEEREILSPSAYKAMNGDTRFLKSTAEETLYKWPYQTIKAIVNNPVYVGDMVNHKVETINYKTKERVHVPREDQIIVHNTHEAIIDRERFEAINQKLSTRRHPNHSLRNAFKGIIFCAECGEKMQLISKTVKAGKRPMFRCPQHAMSKQLCTYNHSVHYDELAGEITKQLRAHILRFLKSSTCNELRNAIADQVLKRAQEIRKAKLQNELQGINKRIKECYKMLQFHEQAAQLDALYIRQKAIMRKITKPSDNAYTLTDEDIDIVKRTFEKQLDENILDESILKLFISRIEIGRIEKDSTESFKKIKLYYRF